MKQIFTLAFFLFTLSFSASSQGVAINATGTTPNNSAMLDVNSTTKGLLIPRMTSLQKAGIVSPADGLMVYDTDLKSFWYFKAGTGWMSMAPGSSAFTLPYDGSVNIAGTAFRVSNNDGPAVEGSSVNGSGVYGNSFAGAGVNALSTNGIGVFANSTNNSAIYAFSNNTNPTIIGSNTNGTGVGIRGNSSLYHGVLGTSGGTNTSGVRGEATGVSGVGVFGTSSGTSGYGVYGSVTNGTGVYGFSTNGTGVKAYSTNLALEVLGNVKISGGNTNPADGAVLTSDASGNAVWKNNRIAFQTEGINTTYQGIANSVTTKVHFEKEEYDYNNNYAFVSSNPTAIGNTFLVPKTGVYHIDCSVDFRLISSAYFTSASILIKIERAGVIKTLGANAGLISNENPGLTDFRFAGAFFSKDFKLMAGDRLWVEAFQENDEAEGATMTGGFFNAHLVFED